MTYGTREQVRGWIECDKSNFPDIEKVIGKYRESFLKYSIKKEIAELYQKGWQIPKDVINWTAYVFLVQILGNITSVF